MILEVLDSPGRKWDEFASQNSGLLFHSSDWGEILREAFGGELFYPCLENDGKILCGMPGIIIEFKFIRILYSMISYGGIIGKFGCEPEILSRLDEALKKHRVHEVKIQGSPGMFQGQLAGFDRIPGASHILDIDGRSESEIESRFSENIRRDIRKAERSNLDIRPIRDRSEVERFFRLYRASMQRQGAMVKYPLKLFGGIYDKWVSRGMADFLMAWHGDQPIAGLCLVYSNDYVHYFMGGALPDFLPFRPNQLLFRRAIGIALERKARFFDFMGSPAGDVNLTKFKEKWGGRPMEVNTYVRSLSPARCFFWHIAQKAAGTKMGARLYRSVGR
jgi:lipid II:glycine glycyltransferase (peptidoglycan interpeptide bridge formation enzyme)